VQQAVGDGDRVHRVIGENRLAVEQFEVLAFDPCMLES